MTDDDRKYLDYIQSVISRMATNSFQVKSWSVALGSVIIGLSAKDAQPTMAWIALIPVLCFWTLDAYYLTLERQYRALYRTAVTNIRAAHAAGTTAATTFDLDADSITGKAWLETALTPSIALIHLALVLVALAVIGWGLSRGTTPGGTTNAATSPEPAGT